MAHTLDEHWRVMLHRHKYVIRFRDKFRAYVKVDERQVSLGSYFTEDEAARAVDECHIYQVCFLIQAAMAKTNIYEDIIINSPSST